MHLTITGSQSHIMCHMPDDETELIMCVIIISENSTSYETRSDTADAYFVGGGVDDIDLS